MSVKLIVAAVLLTAAHCVVAQDFPSRPITMVVPFAAGGPTDTIARILSHAMTATLKQPVVVENTLGAGGTIAAARVAKSTPDGYTFLLHHNGMATSPALYRSLPFNPLTDYEYIGLVADVPMVLIAKKDLPPNNLKELLAYIGANKDKMSLGNAGLGAVSHQCGMLFLSAIKTQLTTIPYKGTAPALNDLLGGQIDLLCDQTTQTTPYIRAGRVKAYGATTKSRIASLPDIPTLHEQGLPGFEMYVWHGFYAPKGTPKAVIDKLSAALQAALKDPAVKTKFADLGAEPVAADKATPEALRDYLKAEIEKWGPIYKKAGVYAD